MDNGLSMDKLESGLNARLDQVKRPSNARLVQKSLKTNQMERIFNNVQIDWSAIISKAVLSKISTLETTVKTQASSISALETTVKNQASSISALETTVSDLETTVKTQASEISTLEGDFIPGSFTRPQWLYWYPGVYTFNQKRQAMEF